VERPLWTPILEVSAWDQQLVEWVRSTTQISLLTLMRPVGRLCDQVSKGEIDAVRKALQTNPELAFQKDKDGMTPLHWAADSGDEELFLMLLAMLGEGPEAFKKVNIRDDNGDTPLHYAVLTERRSVAELLAARGADLYAENDDGETPCALAIAQGWGGIFAAATH